MTDRMPDAEVGEDHPTAAQRLAIALGTVETVGPTEPEPVDDGLGRG